MPVHYDVHLADAAAHLFEVVLTLDTPDPSGAVLWLPVWIPGSYMVREFARNIVTLSASSGGEPVAVHKLDKSTWQLAPASGPVEIRYRVYAWELTVRLAHFDQTHAFFNGTSMFLAVKGREQEPHTVTLHRADEFPDWKVATTLPRTSGGTWDYGEFQASDYDDLVDHPVEMGTFVHARFDACGTPHDIAITGRFRADVDRLVADLKPICEQHIRMFGEPCPTDRYLFLLTVTESGYGGLEHRASSANICKRADLPRVGKPKVSDGYRQLLGLLSHEYFHTWNVKRIKPRAFVPYDLTQENYTTLLWAFEGITSYYDDLGLLRCGRIEVDSWLELIGRNMSRVLAGGGRKVQSLSESSFDAWTKFYRQDENATNSIVSYYGKGAMVALGLDLHIRKVTDGARSLDDVMRLMWERAGDGSGVGEEEVESIASEVAGVDLTPFFDRAVRGTEDLPLEEGLRHMGLRLHRRYRTSLKDPGGKAAASTEGEPPGDLGASMSAGKHGVNLRTVSHGGAAHLAGLSAQDVVVACDGLRVTGTNLFDRIREYPAGATVVLHAFRRDELRTFEVVLQPAPATAIWLDLDPDADAETVARRNRWLGSSSPVA